MWGEGGLGSLPLLSRVIGDGCLPPVSGHRRWLSTSPVSSHRRRLPACAGRCAPLAGQFLVSSKCLMVSSSVPSGTCNGAPSNHEAPARPRWTPARRGTYRSGGVLRPAGVGEEGPRRAVLVFPVTWAPGVCSPVWTGRVTHGLRGRVWSPLLNQCRFHNFWAARCRRPRGATLSMGGPTNHSRPGKPDADHPRPIRPLRRQGPLGHPGAHAGHERRGRLDGASVGAFERRRAPLALAPPAVRAAGAAAPLTH